MDKIVTLIKLGTFFVVLAWLAALLSYIIKKVFRKTPFSKKNIILFSNSFEEKPVISSIVALGLLAIFLFTDNTFAELIGWEKPLSKRPSGTYCYYVEAVEKSTGKSYTVPAKISVEFWTDDDGDGRTVGGVDYFIEQLYFDDGTVVDFGDSSFDEDASFKSFTRYYDEAENEWECRLTEKHAFRSEIQETTSITPSNVILLSVVVAVILFNWFGGLALAVQAKKETE